MSKETFTSIIDLRMMVLLDDLNRSQLTWATPESFKKAGEIIKDVEFAGFHKFRGDDGGEYGSFEVFFNTNKGDGSQLAGDDPPFNKEGWFWWACYPGCLPDTDAEAHGPFPTAEGAYLDALEGENG